MTREVVASKTIVILVVEESKQCLPQDAQPWVLSHTDSLALETLNNDK